MGRVKITTDMIIGIGLCIALIIALIKGSSTEICIGIASNLGGYMGRSLMSEQLAHNALLFPAPKTSNEERLQVSEKTSSLVKTSNAGRKSKTSSQQKGETSSEES